MVFFPTKRLPTAAYQPYTRYTTLGIVERDSKFPILEFYTIHYGRQNNFSFDHSCDVIYIAISSEHTHIIIIQDLLEKW
jgi:hypothetical protein